MTISSIQNAYELLAQYVLAFVEAREWEEAGCHMRIYSKMAHGSQWLSHQGKRDELGGFKERPEAMWAGLTAALYLRDSLLKESGSRIWGLTFYLFPDGKFKIDYDYSRPDDLDESEESLAPSELEEGLVRLEKLGVKLNKN